MRLCVKYPLLPKAPSFGVNLVMDAFGVLPDQGEHIVCEGVDLPIAPGQMVLFTGPSGSGKSSLLREVSQQLSRQTNTVVLDAMALPLPDRPLVDALPIDIQAGLNLLTACGLGEAQLLLRTPSELSEGQRYRFRLALALATLTTRPASTEAWLLADEFTATLDRTLACVLAYNLRRVATKLGVGCLLATTHTDIAPDLSPDLWVQPDLDGRVKLEQPTSTPSRRISFFPTVSTVRAPVLTGPTLPVGTIAATRLASSSGSRSSGMGRSLSASVCSVPPPAACASATATSV